MVLETFRKNIEWLPLTILRISTGLIMAVHGWGKLMSIPQVTEGFAGMGIPFPEVAVYLAIAGEFLGGLGLLVGFLTPIAASGILCTMAVAVFHVHLPNGLLARDGGFEYPMTLIFVALYFICRGAGKISLDNLFSKWFLSKKLP